MSQEVPPNRHQNTSSSNLSIVQKILQEMSYILYGYIQEQLRAVTFDINDLTKTITINFYLDSECSERQQQRLNTAFEIVKKFLCGDFTPYTINPCILRLDYPAQIPKGYFVYLRYEPRFCTASIEYQIYWSDKLSEDELLKLLLMHSLLGKVRPNLRSVVSSVNAMKDLVTFYFYFNGEISDKDQQLANQIVNDAMAHFHSAYTAKIEIERIDYPKLMPELRQAVYKRDEDILKNEIAKACAAMPKNWVNIQTFETRVLYPNNSLHDFLTRIRLHLYGEIHSNWRSVQVAINHVIRKITLWFHYDGKNSKAISNVVELIEQDALQWDVVIVIRTERLDEPSPIPHYGRFLFMRDVLSKTIAKCSVTDYKKIREFITNNMSIPSTLRAVVLDAHDLERDFFILFVYKEIASQQDVSDAQELMQKLKTEFFSNYSCEGYFAHYHHFEPIPLIGQDVYLYPGGEDVKEIGMQRAFLEAVQEGLAGKVPQQLLSVKAALDHFKKIAYYWFFYEAGHTQTAEDENNALAVVELSIPSGYESCIEGYFSDDAYDEPTIGWCVYKRYVPGL
jgi:hypothetical protein